MTIISGKVSYGRTVKTGDYENKRVDVALDFSVPDGESYTSVLALAASEAVAKAYELLGLQAPVKVETSGPAEAARKSKVKPSEAAAKVTEATKVPETDKAPGPVEDFDTTASALPSAPEVEDPSAIDEDFSPLAPEVTDEEIIKAMTVTNARIKNPVLIRQLVGKYVEFPKQAREILQAQRHQFLAELEKLQPAG